MKEEAILVISAPKIVINDSTKYLKKVIYNYDDSHIYFKGKDLGTLLEISDYKQALEKINNLCVDDNKLKYVSKDILQIIDEVLGE